MEGDIEKEEPSLNSIDSLLFHRKSDGGNCLTQDHGELEEY